MDKALWAHNCGASVEEISLLLNIPLDQAMLVIQDINNKRATTAYLHAKAYLMEEVRW